MPAFYTHTPVAPSTLRSRINSNNILSNKKPIGVIAEKIDSAWGYDGDKYYVEVGVWPALAFGTMKMTLEQAKAAYEAISFIDLDVTLWNYNEAKSILRKARKSKHQGDQLMFFFVDEFRKF